MQLHRGDLDFLDITRIYGQEQLFIDGIFRKENGIRIVAIERII